MHASGWVYWLLEDVPRSTGDTITHSDPVEYRFVLEYDRLVYISIQDGSAEGSLGLRGAAVEPVTNEDALGQLASALQCTTADGHVVNIELDTPAARDRWILELNVGALRAVSDALADVQAAAPTRMVVSKRSPPPAPVPVPAVAAVAPAPAPTAASIPAPAVVHAAPEAQALPSDRSRCVPSSATCSLEALFATLGLACARCYLRREGNGAREEML